jgi:integrase
MPKLCLTAEIVDALQPPVRGEVWFGDDHLQHFGVRAWAGKKGGGKAFAIRLRDQFGVLVREVYRPQYDYSAYYWDRGWEKPLGYFLKPARVWALDRIALHCGKETAEVRRRRLWRQRKRKVLATSIGDAIQRKVDFLRSKSKDHLYVDHIWTMIDRHIPARVLNSTFRNVPIRQLADAITNRNISYGNVKVLRGFVGGVFKDAADVFGPLHYKLESIQRRCARNLDARTEPPYPQILRISDGDYRRFFNELEASEAWRQALAIRLYFETGAKLQQVLRARWSDLVENVWYPFLPEERKLWFESKERLNEEAQRVLRLIAKCHLAEGLASPYLFPSITGPHHSISTVQRHWARYSAKFGWQALPMSHVVLRHRDRSNPSYSLFFYRTYLQSGRPKAKAAVSKVAKRRTDKSITAETYMVGCSPPENLIA